MESHKTAPFSGHILAVPYPTQGHINPMLQLCKRVSSTRPSVKSTFAVTEFIASTFPPANLPSSISLATISDGFDSGGFDSAASIDAYLATLEAAGRRSLSDLIAQLAQTPTPATCVVYDAFSPWALDVARAHGLTAAAFFTQPCTVNYIYYLLQRGEWSAEEVVKAGTVKVPELETELGTEDLPSFVGNPGSYPHYFRLVLNQHLNVHLADCILVNTFYELESQVLDSMSKHTPLLPIGPTIPSLYLDQQQDPNDKDYGLHIFNFQDSTTAAAIEWLSTKPSGSAIYVSFGSLSGFEPEQVKEVAHALKQSGHDFLWALRATEQPKIPKGFVEEMSALGKGMLVDWCTQIQVLSNDAIGCFLTHCGWNSTQEALSVGIPMVALPQWTDQPPNAKLVQDVWKVGLRAMAGENGIVPREEIGRCIREVMDDEKGREMRANARRWRDLARQAFARGGSSDRNIDMFLSKCVHRLETDSSIDPNFV